MIERKVFKRYSKLKKNLILSGACFSLAFLLFLYQNCSEQPAVLVKIPSKHSESSKFSLRTILCPEVSFLDDEHNNFLFIIDMSMSNIGNFKKGTRTDQYGRTLVTYYWDTSVGKDVNGQRFDAIRNFIDSCANSPNNKFAVIGFSKEAGHLFEVGPYSAVKRPALNCKDSISFGGKDNAKSTLENLKAAEKFEADYYSQWKYPNHYNENPSHRSSSLVFTSYSKATQCANRIIYRDLIESFEDDVDNYHIVFISDGRPKDYNVCKGKTGQARATCYSENPSCEEFSNQAEKDNCYIKTSVEPFKQSVYEVGSIRRKINLLTVGYGLTDQNDYRFLNELARITRDNGRAQRLNSFEGNRDVLCEMISSSFGVETNSDSLMSVVLSLNHRNGVYKSDSDMDGLLDEDEESLGYNPSNPRSQVGGVLDGLCEKIGGIASCNLAMEQVDCETSLLKSDGLSDCDVKLIKSHWKSLNLDDSSDWDRDGVPNFIEIVKGTDPFIDDMNEDPDGDFISTRTEIMHSRNPFEHESFSPSNLPRVIVDNGFSSPVTSQCPRRMRHLILKEVPFIESRSVDAGMGPELFHGKNGHIVAIFSSRKTQNYLLQSKGVIGKYVKLNAIEEDDSWVLVPSLTELTNSDLDVWGQP